MKWVGYAIAIHAVLLLAILAYFGIPKINQDPVVVLTPEKSLTGGPVQGPQQAPAPGEASGKSSAVLKELRGLKLQPSAPVAGRPLASATSSATKARGGVMELALAQKFTKEEDDAERAMTAAERAELKRKFRALESELRKVYARALTQDPHLELTISFEAEVARSGYLTLSSFHADGTYRAESLALFRTRMTELLGGISVAEDLAGTVVRGESVFTR